MFGLDEMCNIGDIVLIKKGKNKKLIAHTKNGKVIIPINKVRCGYMKITKILKNTEKYILVKGKNILLDYYDDISYKDFLKVLSINDYKIGFDRPFETDYDYGTEHQILAYNLNNGSVIVAETFYGSKTFNKIEVYCPNVNGLTKKISMQSIGSYTMTILDLCKVKNFYRPLKWANGIIKNKIWDESNCIDLWTYVDADESSDSLWENTIHRILLANKELENVLGHCKKLKPIFEKRINSLNMEINE